MKKLILLLLLIILAPKVNAQADIDFVLRYSKSVYTCSNEGCNNSYTRDMPVQLMSIQNGDFEDIAILLHNATVRYWAEEVYKAKYCNNRNFNKCNYKYVNTASNRKVTVAKKSQVASLHKTYGNVFEKNIPSLNLYFDKNPEEKKAFIQRRKDLEKQEKDRVLALEQKKQKEIEKKKEAERIEKARLENEKIARVKKIKSTPITEYEESYIGRWNLVGQKRYEKTKYDIEYDELNFDLTLNEDRGFLLVANYSKSELVYNTSYQRYERGKLKWKHKYTFKGVWIEADSKVIDLVYQEYEEQGGTLNEQGIKNVANSFYTRLNQIKIHEISKKKLQCEIMEILLSGKKQK